MTPITGTSTGSQVAGQVSRHRLMGWLAVAGALCYIVGAIWVFRDSAETPLSSVLNLLWTLGSLCGLIGVGMLGVAGRNLFGRIALAVAMLAYALAALDGLLILIGVFTGEGSPLFAVSRLGTLVGMTLLGVATLVARRWPGWRKFSPFAIPLAMPVALLVGLVTNGSIPIPLYIGIAWLIIGYAVISTAEPVKGVS